MHGYRIGCHAPPIEFYIYIYIYNVTAFAESEITHHKLPLIIIEVA